MFLPLISFTLDRFHPDNLLVSARMSRAEPLGPLEWARAVRADFPTTNLTSVREARVHVTGRGSNRHMKGQQVALSLYLPPRKYWLLKSISSKAGVSMQRLLREALDQVLADAYRTSGRYK